MQFSIYNLNFPFFQQDKPNVSYELFGVISHKGYRVDSGSFYSYVKVSNQWIFFEDEHYYLAKTNKIVSKNALFLFYSLSDSVEVISSNEISEQTIPSSFQSEKFLDPTFLINLLEPKAQHFWRSNFKEQFVVSWSLFCFPIKLNFQKTMNLEEEKCQQLLSTLKLHLNVLDEYVTPITIYQATNNTDFNEYIKKVCNL